VLFCGVNLEKAQEACERVRAQLAAAIVEAPSGEEVRTTVSVGLAAAGATTTLENALQAADAALYRAKDRGRNRLAIAA